MATVKKDSCSSHDQLRGKAERRAKKTLYEYITGCDFGDADEQSSAEEAAFEDVTEKVNNEIKEKANNSGTINFDEPAASTKQTKEDATTSRQQTQEQFPNERKRNF